MYHSSLTFSDITKTWIVINNTRYLLTSITFYFSSPDSDDTFGGDEPDEDFSGRDDQFLVSDRTENKFYGKITIHFLIY